MSEIGREVDWLNLEVGRRFYNRAGAIVEIIERRDSGLAQFDLDWKPRGNAMLIVVKTINGNGRYAVFDNGNYHSSEDHPLDLMREAPKRGKWMARKIALRKK